MKYVDGAAIIENFRKGFEGTSVASQEFADTLNKCLSETRLDEMANTYIDIGSAQEMEFQDPEPYMDRTLVDAFSHLDRDLHITFVCPCCGTHYIARSEGFIPNCHNCGSVMKEVC